MEARFRHWIKKKKRLLRLFISQIRLFFSEMLDVNSRFWEIKSELRDINLQLQDIKVLFTLVRFSFNNNNNNHLLHLYSAFLGTQSTLHRRRESPQPPPMCRIHLDDATAAILRQNTHHTPAYWCRGDKVMKPIGVWGLLGGHDGQRPMGKFGQDAGVTPLLFFEGHPGIFNDHRETGPRFKVSSEGQVSLSLYWGFNF